MRWLLLFVLLVMPVGAQPATHQDLEDLIALARSASDLLQGIVADSKALIKDYRRPDPFSYQPAVKSLSFQALTLKGKIARLQEAKPLQDALNEAGELAGAGMADLQSCLDQLNVLADRPEIQPERERLLATLTRTQDTLARLAAVLARADRLFNDTPASPPTPTPPQ